MVADLQVAHAGTDRLDDARALVAAAERQVRHRDIALGDVVVGVAQARGDVADEHLVLAGLIDLELDDFPIARSLEEDCCPRRDRHLVTLPPWL